MKRRGFLERSALAAAALALPVRAAEAGGGGRPRVLFSKGLEGLGPKELAETVARLQVSGLEAPIRRGGHIEPTEAGKMLPEFVRALADPGLTIEIAASDVDKADDAAAEYLKALAASGVRRYRLKHYRYDLAKPLQPQLAEVRAKLRDLAQLNAELGVQGQYQNHRGHDYVGAPIWDMVSVLEEIDPQHLGMAFDFAHATVEGGNTWELNLRRAKDHVVAVYFKDYRLDGREWSACPLGEGVVSPKSGELVASLLPADTPVSLHVEYLKYGSDNFAPRMIEAAAKDLTTLRKWLPA